MKRKHQQQLTDYGKPDSQHPDDSISDEDEELHAALCMDRHDYEDSSSALVKGLEGLLVDVFVDDHLPLWGVSEEYYDWRASLPRLNSD